MILKDVPSLIEIEPTSGCNLKCRMCHVSFLKQVSEFLDLNQVKDFSFLKGKTVILGAVYEPFIHPEINKLIGILNRQGCRLAIITNAKNLHKKNIPAIFESDLESVTFSFDGVTKNSYEEIRKGGNYDQTLENIKNFRTAFSDRDTFFAVNSTVLLNNLSEVPLAPAFWEEYGIDLIRFISMVIRNKSEFLEKNSLWERRNDFFQRLDQAAQSIDESNYNVSISSPYFQSKQAKEKWLDRVNNGVFQSKKSDRKQRIYHREYEFGASYDMSFPCKSPFVAARVTWDGNVNICHNIWVGNLYENTFEEIWDGKDAKEHRQRVLNDTSFCDNCDFFRFCINSHYIDLNDIDNYYDKNMRGTAPK